MLRELIEKKRVDFYEGFASWEDAVRAGCRSLEADGSVTGEYAEAILENVRAYGPYIVIMEDLAIPHTKANARGVLRSAISFTKLRQPVSFEPGNPEKDARLLFTLAASDLDEHYANMEKLGELLLNDELLQALKQVQNLEDLQALAERYG